MNALTRAPISEALQGSPRMPHETKTPIRPDCSPDVRAGHDRGSGRSVCC